MFEIFRISEFVTDQSACLSLIELLLPFLGEGLSRTPDTEVNILNSIRNLLEKVEDKKKFYRQFMDCIQGNIHLVLFRPHFFNNCVTQKEYLFLNCVRGDFKREGNLLQDQCKKTIKTWGENNPVTVDHYCTECTQISMIFIKRSFTGSYILNNHLFFLQCS